MARGKSKSRKEMALLVKEVEDKLKEQKNKSISQVCDDLGISRKSYYYYSDKVDESVVIDKRTTKKIPFHERGEQFLTEFSLLCPILSTRTLHKLYNEFFVPDYNRRLQLLKNPPEPKIPNVKNGDKLIERTRQRNKCLAIRNSNVKEVWPESYFRINNKIKQMGLGKEKVRMEKAIEILKPIVEKQLGERYGFLYEGELALERANKRDLMIKKRGYNHETFSLILDIASPKIMLKSVEIDVFLLGWLKDYASRNPKKTANFLSRLKVDA